MSTGKKAHEMRRPLRRVLTLWANAGIGRRRYDRDKVEHNERHPTDSVQAHPCWRARKSARFRRLLSNPFKGAIAAKAWDAIERFRITDPREEPAAEELPPRHRVSAFGASSLLPERQHLGRKWTWRASFPQRPLCLIRTLKSHGQLTAQFLTCREI